MYTVLARKWRPRKFDEIIGQKHVATTLSNAINMDRVAHAYVFSGPRGVGKTSIARILAKSLNCDQGPSTTPCLKCTNCLEISSGQSLDVIEIDGASNRRIDDVRELEEHVKFMPVSGKYKIYIIDEVHMLTKEAFNALLKTLEEPPEHVKFFLATTEAEKIPDTIRSRCQVFEFQRISSKEIVAHLSQIIEQEQLSIPKELLYDVARVSEGSMRDAQSTLDQVISFCGQEVKASDVEMILGTMGFASLGQFAEKLFSGQTTECLQFIAEMVSQGKDIYRFTLSLTQYVRNVLVLSVEPSPSESLLEMTEEEIAQAQTVLAHSSMEDLLYALNVLVRLEDSVKRAVSPRIPLEMAVIKLTRMSDLTQLPALLASKPQNSVPQGGLVQKTARVPQSIKAAVEPQGEAVAQQPVIPLKADLAHVWKQFSQQMKKQKMSLGMMLLKTKPLSFEDSVLTVALPENDPFSAQNLQRQEHLDLCQKVIKQCAGEQAQFRFQQNTSHTSAASAEVAPASTALQAKAEKPVEPASKRRNFEIVQDPFVKKTIERFDGRVLDIS